MQNEEEARRYKLMLFSMYSKEYAASWSVVLCIILTLPSVLIVTINSHHALGQTPSVQFIDKFEDGRAEARLNFTLPTTDSSLRLIFPPEAFCLNASLEFRGE
ncbi:MAG: hypothetical protein QW728_04855, partial [Thermoplasmata archaeon]